MTLLGMLIGSPCKLTGSRFCFDIYGVCGNPQLPQFQVRGNREAFPVGLIQCWILFILISTPKE